MHARLASADRFTSTVRVALAVLLAFSSVVAKADWRGNASLEATWFPNQTDGLDNYQFGTSVALDAEYYRDLIEDVSFTARPFLRVDQHDPERTHADLREFVITTSTDTWEFSGGISTVFWGVTESRHLVDVINQTDSVDGVDGEDKLGQVMLSLKLFRESGEWEFYLLPHFRERTFAGIDGRPSIGAVVDTDRATFQSEDGTEHLDNAVRWSRSFDTFDLGLHYFYGTRRDPQFRPEIRNGAVHLIPHYVLMDQAGIDAQAILGDWLLKAEGIYQRGSQIDDHYELVTGFEYTIVGVLAPLQDNEILSTEKCLAEDAGLLRRLICNDRMDLGIVSEFLWDERQENAGHPFQRDLLLGLRFAFNNEASTDALFGVIQDLDGGATSVSLEASRRIGDSFRLGVEARHFANTDDDPALTAFENESFLRLELAYYF